VNKQVKRHLKLVQDHSLFLFGPRGSGKSTLIQNEFAKKSLYIDLLDIETEDLLIQNPSELKNIVKKLGKKTSHIIIDEIQKIPKLLDLVHLLIESTDKKFILTGSSARKLKYGNANLLAGRAFVYNLHPFTSLELGKYFDLNQAMHWGSLPKLQELDTVVKKNLFLTSYAQTYLKEEVQAEQLVRKLTPFRNFLQVAAQMNGKIINLSKISRDVKVEDKTIGEYYSILEDTLLGFTLHGFENSFRKQLSTKPKFYFFDTGVTRALNRSLSNTLQEGTYAYGEAFEHFIILECVKLASYYKHDYQFSYLKTKDDAEIDLVVDRPGKPILFIEIKSSKQVRDEDLTTFARLVKDFKKTGDKCEAVCFSRDPYQKQIDDISIFPWQEGLKEYFT
jgi:uncharacterized protein